MPLESSIAGTLITALNAELASQHPEEGANHFRLDSEEVADGIGAFMVAFDRGRPVGCGAIRQLDQSTVEVKRMYVEPAARARGVARSILCALEQEAARLGVERIVLETGVRQVAALRLYESVGFVRIPSFGEYTSSPVSVCMEKRIRTLRIG